MSINKDLISKVPLDISTQILFYLSPEDLCRASQVSKAWQIRANQEILWKIFVQRHALVSSQSNNSKDLVIEFIKNKKDKYVCVVSSRKELFKKIGVLFKKHTKLIIESKELSGTDSKGPRGIALRYTSNSDPRACLHATIFHSTDYYNRFMNLSTTENNFSIATIKLTIIGKDQADFADDVFMNRLSNYSSAEKGFLGFGVKQGTIRETTTFAIQQKFVESVHKILRKAY